MKHCAHRGGTVFAAQTASRGQAVGRGILCGLAALTLLAGCDRNKQTPAPGKQSSAESVLVTPAAPPIRGPAVLPDHGQSGNVANQPHTWSIGWENHGAATMPAVLRADHAVGDKLGQADTAFLRDAAVGNSSF